MLVPALSSLRARASVAPEHANSGLIQTALSELSPPADKSGGWRLRLSGQPRDGGAEVRRSVVPELDDTGMTVERLLHDAPLHAAPAPVNQAYLAKAGSGGGVNVLGDDGRNVARRECMQIELAENRNADSHQSPFTAPQFLGPPVPKPPSPLFDIQP